MFKDLKKTEQRIRISSEKMFFIKNDDNNLLISTVLRSLTVSRVGNYQSKKKKITLNLDDKWRVWERAVTFSPVLIFELLSEVE